MMIAERKVAYEKNYGGYSFDVKPRVGRQQRRTAAMSARDKGRMLWVIIVFGIICLGIIVSSAYGAAVNYSNNQIREENIALQGEVDSLNVEIQTANNIASIEKKALAQGMIYPEGAQFVVVSSQEKPEEGFAGLLKEQAFH